MQRIKTVTTPAVEESSDDNSSTTGTTTTTSTCGHTTEEECGVEDCCMGGIKLEEDDECFQSGSNVGWDIDDLSREEIELCIGDDAEEDAGVSSSHVVM